MGQQYDLIIYVKLTNPKMRLVRVGDGKIWDRANDTVSATPTYADTVVTLTPDNTYIGGTPVKIPANLPTGNWDLLIYDTASPAVTDSVVRARRIAWTGNQLSGLPLSL